MSQRVWAAASVATKGRTAAAASFFEFMVRSLKGRTAAVCQTRGEGVNRAASRARRSGPKGSGLAGDNNLRHLVIMIRTQISLTKPEYEAAKREAARVGVSLAELLRRSLRTVIPVDESKPWMRYAGMVESGDVPSSRHLDDVVYGQKA